LIELIATKDKFFSIIAHDLKNPFNTILGFSELLHNNIEKYDNTKILKFANSIHSAATQTFTLLENLLEWSRLQRGMIVPRFMNLNLKFVANEIETVCAAAAKSKKIELINNIISDVYVEADNEMTKSIFRNLVSNAIKFTKLCGVVKLDYKETDNHVQVQVSDNGIGIQTENLPFLFKIEKNISTPGTADEKGTGLGLQLCKELIEKQEGKIWCESKENEGSIFYFTLKKAKTNV